MSLVSGDAFFFWGAGGMTVLSAGVGLGGCPREMPVEPMIHVTDSDGLGTPVGEACRALRAVGCPEGNTNTRGRTCFQTLTVAESFSPLGPDGGRVALLPSACLVSAKTREDVRACGGRDSIRVRCPESDGGDR